MTNEEYIFALMKQTFGFSISRNRYGNFEVEDCQGLRCGDCPLHERCCDSGIKEWLKEINDREKIEENSIKSYEDGIKEGREQVIKELSQIFTRKEVSE